MRFNQLTKRKGNVMSRIKDKKRIVSYSIVKKDKFINFYFNEAAIKRMCFSYGDVLRFSYNLRTQIGFIEKMGEKGDRTKRGYSYVLSKETDDYDAKVSVRYNKLNEKFPYLSKGDVRVLFLEEIVHGEKYKWTLPSPDGAVAIYDSFITKKDWNDQFKTAVAKNLKDTGVIGSFLKSQRDRQGGISKKKEKLELDSCDFLVNKFISASDYRKDGGQIKSKKRFLSISKINIGAYSYLNFYFSEGLLEEFNVEAGDRVDVLYNPYKKEGKIIKVKDKKELGWKISFPNGVGRSGKIAIPLSTLPSFFPKGEQLTELKIIKIFPQKGINWAL